MSTCSLIKHDMASDVASFDGKPLDGKIVAEIHGNLAAAISALADMVGELTKAIAGGE